MSLIILDTCVNCDVCEPVCPNKAISLGEVYYEINPDLCTECVGFHDYEACQAVCPVECCIPDPNIPEPEGELLDRAQKIHPEKQFPPLTQLPAHLSRFRRPAA